MSIEPYELMQMQSLPLEVKIRKTEQRIIEWYEYYNGQVAISFSGGKDSTVLTYIARNLYPNINIVFSDTGLEYPEIRDFVKTFNNIDWVKPKMHFKQVLERYGYPVVSKHVSKCIQDLRNTSGNNEATKRIRLTGYTSSGRLCTSQKLPKKWHFLLDAPFKISADCCRVIKKQPLEAYYKKNNFTLLTGEMANESYPRRLVFLNNGCNAYNLKRPKSTPLGFWTEQDVLKYLKDNELPYAKVYGDIVTDKFGKLHCTGEKRTGCMFCLFGIQHEIGQNKFTRMKDAHPTQYDYCINKLSIGEVLDYLGVIY